MYENPSSVAHSVIGKASRLVHFVLEEGQMLNNKELKMQIMTAAYCHTNRLLAKSYQEYQQPGPNSLPCKEGCRAFKMPSVRALDQK